MRSSWSRWDILGGKITNQITQPTAVHFLLSCILTFHHPTPQTPHFRSYFWGNQTWHPRTIASEFNNSMRNPLWKHKYTCLFQNTVFMWAVPDKSTFRKQALKWPAQLWSGSMLTALNVPWNGCLRNGDIPLSCGLKWSAVVERCPWLDSKCLCWYNFKWVTSQSTKPCCFSMSFQNLLVTLWNILVCFYCEKPWWADSE